MAEGSKGAQCSLCGGRTEQGYIVGRWQSRWRGKASKKFMGIEVVPGPEAFVVGCLCEGCGHLDLFAEGAPALRKAGD